MKPGWLTSESHQTFGMILVGVLIVTGHVGADDPNAEGLAAALDDAVAKLCGAAMAIWPVLKYTGTRAELKRQKMNLDPPDPAQIEELVNRFVRRALRSPGPRLLKPDTEPAVSHRQPDPNDDPPRAA